MKKKINWWQVINYSLIVLLATECVLLTLQNKELKRTLSTTPSMGQTEPLKPGERVEPIKITNLDGNISKLDYDGPDKQYLLFVLSTTCPHCEKTLANWKEIVKHNKEDNCNILGLSIHDLDRTKEYVAEKHLDFYLASVSSDTSFNRKYKINGVPETILLKGNGTVEKVWIGELSAEQTNEIQSMMRAPKGRTN